MATSGTEVPQNTTIKKYMIAIFLMMDTAYKRIKKSTTLELAVEANTEEQDFIADKTPSEILKNYSVSLAQDLTMIKGEEDFEYIWEQFYSKVPNNEEIKTKAMIAFMFDGDKTAGYKAWETKFNRHVKQGEKGIVILAPMKYKKDPDDEDSEVYIRFRTTAVFDISQTEGEELPSFSPVSIVKDVNGYQKLFTALAKLTDYKIEFAALAKDTCKGTCNFTTHTITIREGMSESENLSTLIHEIAHSILHEDEHNSRNQAEVEAESVAFVVSTFLGLDTSDYSFPYIVGWEENDVDLLRQSLQRIKTTSNSLITQLENELQNGTEQKSNEKEVKTKEEVKATQTMKLF